MPARAFEFATIEIPCPHCDKCGPQLIRELVANDAIPCIYCRGSIDLKDRRALIDEAAKQFNEIWIRTS